MKANQRGQALIELIVFLPLMFALYGMISGFANAINGSINQQKVTRSYYYFRIQNSSMVPRPELSVATGLSTFGMSFVGWMERLEGIEPVAPCYRISVPGPVPAGDTCDTEYGDAHTQFIRVGTAYGICGATFSKAASGDFYLIPDNLDDFQRLLDVSSCTMKK
jgi:hypothetical protein